MEKRKKKCVKSEKSDAKIKQLVIDDDFVIYVSIHLLSFYYNYIIN